MAQPRPFPPPCSVEDTNSKAAEGVTTTALPSSPYVPCIHSRHRAVSDWPQPDQQIIARERSRSNHFGKLRTVSSAPYVGHLTIEKLQTVTSVTDVLGWFWQAACDQKRGHDHEKDSASVGPGLRIHREDGCGDGCFAYGSSKGR